ncbi:MAG: hypothetical protein ACKO34_07940 [Vampirovibrionales bacterium]
MNMMFPTPAFASSTSTTGWSHSLATTGSRDNATLANPAPLYRFFPNPQHNTPTLPQFTSLAGSQAWGSPPQNLAFAHASAGNHQGSYQGWLPNLTTLDLGTVFGPGLQGTTRFLGSLTQTESLQQTPLPIYPPMSYGGYVGYLPPYGLAQNSPYSMTIGWTSGYPSQPLYGVGTAAPTFPFLPQPPAQRVLYRFEPDSLEPPPPPEVDPANPNPSTPTLNGRSGVGADEQWSFWGDPHVGLTRNATALDLNTAGDTQFDIVDAGTWNLLKDRGINLNATTEKFSHWNLSVTTKVGLDINGAGLTFNADGQLTIAGETINKGETVKLEDGTTVTFDGTTVLVNTDPTHAEYNLGFKLVDSGKDENGKRIFYIDSFAKPHAGGVLKDNIKPTGIWEGFGEESPDAEKTLSQPKSTFLRNSLLESGQANLFWKANTGRGNVIVSKQGGGSTEGTLGQADPMIATLQPVITPPPQAGS